MFVLGTAGHIDHGKSSLIKAMTGIDPDRLPEEKERGMTIDLGFAWLTLPDGSEIGLVDVPGHERFVRNMVAGAGGVNAAMLVVAADDGWMPQTQEHFDILNLLDIKYGLVAVTKIDLVEPDWLELVMVDIKSKLAGSFLAEAPILPVSSTTGEGVKEVVEAISQLSQKLQSVEDIGKARLFVDRPVPAAAAVFRPIPMSTISPAGIASGCVRFSRIRKKSNGSGPEPGWLSI